MNESAPISKVRSKPRGSVVPPRSACSLTSLNLLKMRIRPKNPKRHSQWRLWVSAHRTVCRIGCLFSGRVTKFKGNEIQLTRLESSDMLVSLLLETYP